MAFIFCCLKTKKVLLQGFPNCFCWIDKGFPTAKNQFCHEKCKFFAQNIAEAADGNKYLLPNGNNPNFF